MQNELYTNYAELVRHRLSDIDVTTIDVHQNEVINAKNVFSDLQIRKFLEISLLRLNCFLSMMNLKLVEEKVESCLFGDMIVQGAVITALASKALIEAGREFSYEDKGVAYYSPNISYIFMNQWELELQDYRFKIDLLQKQHLKE